MTMGDSSIWALAILDAAGGHVEGVTRLQKYAFLIAKRIKGITGLGFYNDWRASNYGPFSSQLANDINELVDSGLVRGDPKPNAYGYKVAMIIPTSSAKARIEEFKKTEPKLHNGMKKLVSGYQHKRLVDLLHDVYYLYPEYATQSKIRNQVGGQTYESDSYLNPEYDNPND